MGFLVVMQSFGADFLSQVTALGIAVPGISLSTKKVTLKGMDSLKNGVVINSFDLPSNNAAGGITLNINSTVTNVSAFLNCNLVISNLFSSLRKSASPSAPYSLMLSSPRPTWVPLVLEALSLWHRFLLSTCL